MLNGTSGCVTAWRLAATVVSLLTLALFAPPAGVAAAQEASMAGRVAADADPAALARRAEALAANPSRWHEAAQLYQVSANLREEGDPEAARSLRRSGQLFASVGELERAGEALEAAGDAALLADDVLQAAESYFEAMVTARARGSTAEARRLERTVRRLATSDRLTRPQRDRLLARLRKSGGRR